MQSEISTKVYPRLAGGICFDAAAVSEMELAMRLLEFSLPPIVKAAADSMAADATALTKHSWSNPFAYPVLLVGGIISPAAALTADATNNASILVKVDDAANGTPATALTWTTSLVGTGSWVADTAEAPTAFAAAAQIILPGACVFWEITKGGSGVVVPIMNIELVCRKA